ncbi:glycosyltransferase family 2 protein [Algibacter sp. L1A34]|uniref:glycosyltransferase family 2 protein n=1 Tax=Algibacter sp. L1A34 TaxID=2686365 RepID=UPI00131BB031|nr:glycosyltransferase family 2 protein [Algibacter sp. L1A34]
MISIVIPLFNKETTIKDTIESVLSQSFTNFELIIIDDGSTDDSVNTISNNFKDERIKIIPQKNQGVSVARNQGVKNARHELIAFLDADDLWSPEYLEYMVKAHNKHPEAGMYCCAGFVKNADDSIYKRTTDKVSEDISMIHFFHNPHIFLHTSSTIVKKTIFEKVGGFPKGMVRNQDFALFFSIALISKVCYCKLPLSTYVGGVPNQATSSFSITKLQSIVDRFNIVHNNWINSNRKNKDYLVFTKYEVRHMILSNIRSKEFEFMNYFLNNLSEELISEFYSLEIKIYRSKKFNFLSKYWILFTKIIWRSKNYPRVG